MKKYNVDTTYNLIETRLKPQFCILMWKMWWHSEGLL